MQTGLSVSLHGVIGGLIAVGDHSAANLFRRLTVRENRQEVNEVTLITFSRASIAFAADLARDLPRHHNR